MIPPETIVKILRMLYRDDAEGLTFLDRRLERLKQADDDDSMEISETLELARALIATRH